MTNFIQKYYRTIFFYKNYLEIRDIKFEEHLLFLNPAIEC